MKKPARKTKPKEKTFKVSQSELYTIYKEMTKQLETRIEKRVLASIRSQNRSRRWI